MPPSPTPPSPPVVRAPGPPSRPFPTGATSVTGISCLGTTCVAIGTTRQSPTSTAAVWTGDLTSTPDNWVQSNRIPNDAGEVSGVACGAPAAGTDTADCVVSAASSNGAGSGQLLLGSLKATGRGTPFPLRRASHLSTTRGWLAKIFRRGDMRRGRRNRHRAGGPCLAGRTRGSWSVTDTFACAGGATSCFRHPSSSRPRLATAAYVHECPRFRPAYFCYPVRSSGYSVAAASAARSDRPFSTSRRARSDRLGDRPPGDAPTEPD